MRTWGAQAVSSCPYSTCSSWQLMLNLFDEHTTFFFSSFFASGTPSYVLSLPDDTTATLLGWFNWVSS